MNNLKPGFLTSFFQYRELLFVLAWKDITVRYKQAYFGILWAALKPLLLMLIFLVVKSFVGIDSGSIPYPLLTFTALVPWVFFQEATSDGVNSVVSNAALVKKIYFPREIFPLSSTITKLVELSITSTLLALMFIYYKNLPGIHALWIPFLVLYLALFSYTISLFGSALNVYYRDIRTLLPIAISLLMYLSPIIYPFHLVKETLLVHQAAGSLSDTIFFLYTANPLCGIIDAFQNTLLRNLPPNWEIIKPGLITTLVLFPLCSYTFKKSEQYFADVI